MKYVSEEALQSGLKDKSAYVRKTAVLGIVKVFHTDPGVVNSESLEDHHSVNLCTYFSLSSTEINFVDLLYDRDPQVVSNCISALVEILASEGGMVVTTKIAHYLLNRSEMNAVSMDTHGCTCSCIVRLNPSYSGLYVASREGNPSVCDHTGLHSTE